MGELSILSEEELFSFLLVHNNSFNVSELGSLEAFLWRSFAVCAGPSRVQRLTVLDQMVTPCDTWVSSLSWPDPLVNQCCEQRSVLGSASQNSQRPLGPNAGRTRAASAASVGGWVVPQSRGLQHQHGPRARWFHLLFASGSSLH